MPNLVFIDTETDGVHPERRAWEIAMIRRDGDKQRRTRLFVEIDLSTADPFGLKVGGFYERHPLGRKISSAPSPVDTPQYVSPEDAASTVAQWTHGAHLVGINPAFDAEVLSTLLRDNYLIPSWHYHVVDVSALMLGWLNGIGQKTQPPWSSDELSRWCGVVPPDKEDRHTAMGDAEWAMKIYDRITTRR